MPAPASAAHGGSGATTSTPAGTCTSPRAVRSVNPRQRGAGPASQPRLTCIATTVLAGAATTIVPWQVTVSRRSRATRRALRTCATASPITASVANQARPSSTGANCVIRCSHGRVSTSPEGAHSSATPRVHAPRPAPTR